MKERRERWEKCGSEKQTPGRHLVGGERDMREREERGRESERKEIKSWPE